jgi:FAD/FMN-containing dehydrogenase
VSASQNDSSTTNRKLKRRDFLKAVSAVPFLTGPVLDSPRGTLVNDVHTGWNPTWVDRVEQPTGGAEVEALIKSSRKRGKVISVSGSRHATGGQQFAARSVLLDMRRMNRVVGLDAKS